MTSTVASATPLPKQHLLLSLRPEVQELKEKLDKFVEEECIPAEVEYEQHMSKRYGGDRWTVDAVPSCVDRLKTKAKTLGLWNLFIPPNLISKIPTSAELYCKPTTTLSYREYGILCESMGRSFLASEACNCSAPDTGNMEVLLHFGTRNQNNQWLVPLLEGKIRSAFLMTEPNVASSDATNIETKLTKIETNDGKIHYKLNGRKWWSTGAMDPRCKVALVLCKMDGNNNNIGVGGSKGRPQTQRQQGRHHGNHTVVVVPMNKSGVKMVRPLTVFGYDDAPHGHAEVLLDNISLSQEDLIIGEGYGFMISQARLGPGRIHHCMRSIGLASRCYELMLQRTMQRKTFGKYLHEHGSCQDVIANSASDINAARLLTLDCASSMDAVGPRQARDKIASIKVSVPRLTINVIDRAVQVFGGAGVCQDFVLAKALASMRTLRIADGPDAVHKLTVAKLEIKKMKKKLTMKKEVTRSRL